MQKHIKKVFLLLITMILVNISIYAVPAISEKIKEEEAAQNKIDEAKMVKIIKKLYENAGSDPYLLSLPLLINAEYSAQKGNPKQTQKLYKKNLRAINNALDKIIEDDPQNNRNSFKAWILGRVLVAAQNMKDESTVQKTKMTLHALLENPNTPSDAMYTWALGYYTGSGKAEYEQYTPEERLEPEYALSTSYQDLARSMEEKRGFLNEQNIENLQAQQSNALWGWVMALNAAAKVNDQKSYEEILGQILSMTRQKTVATALTKRLVRSSTTNNYQAWALSLVFLSAAEMGDVKLYEEVEDPLMESIHHAKNMGAEAEALLAQLTFNRAEMLMKQKGLLTEDKMLFPPARE